MKRLACTILFLFVFLAKLSAREAEVPDTVHVGVYIISIHDIDFRQKQYTVRFWLWMRYKNPEFDFARNIEVPNAKSMEISDQIVDTSDGGIYVLMKMKCVMKETWNVKNYPFDRQHLEVFIENSQFDRRSLVFAADSIGQNHDPELTVSGWHIPRFLVHTGIRRYETAFGDASLNVPYSEYGSVNIEIDIERNAWGLFFKIFLGMYVAFLITYVCFFIHGDQIDSRFGLSVGALFAAVGNKYIIDSILPESSTFTLVDVLHGFTFTAIFATIWCAVHTLNMVKRGQLEKANKLDVKAARILLITYITLNVISVAIAIMA